MKNDSVDGLLMTVYSYTLGKKVHYCFNSLKQWIAFGHAIRSGGEIDHRMINYSHAVKKGIVFA